VDHFDGRLKAGAAVNGDSVPQTGLLINRGEVRDVFVLGVSTVMLTDSGNAAEPEGGAQRRCGWQFEIPNVQLEWNIQTRLSGN
jgi:hypothetical protein